MRKHLKTSSSTPQAYESQPYFYLKASSRIAQTIAKKPKSHAMLTMTRTNWPSFCCTREGRRGPRGTQYEAAGKKRPSPSVMLLPPPELCRDHGSGSAPLPPCSTLFHACPVTILTNSRWKSEGRKMRVFGDTERISFGMSSLVG